VPAVIETPDKIARAPFRWTATGVIATGSPTFEQWELALQWSEAIKEASPWWIGDLLLLGEAAFGDFHNAALNDYDPETLANLKYISRAVPPSRRRDALSHSHHGTVASLPPDEQTMWLEKAETEHLSVHALRRQIQESKNVHTVVAPAPKTATVVRGESTTIAIKAPYFPRDPQPSAFEVRPRNSEEPRPVQAHLRRTADVEEPAPVPPEIDLRTELRRLVEVSRERYAKVKKARHAPIVKHRELIDWMLDELARLTAPV
jgi:hypothetical protein